MGRSATVNTRKGDGLPQAENDVLSDSVFLPTYSKRPPVHPLSLSFYSGELEHDFHEFNVNRSLGFARIVLFLAIFLYLIFGVLDYFIAPEAIASLLTIRVLISFFILKERYTDMNIPSNCSGNMPPWNL